MLTLTMAKKNRKLSLWIMGPLFLLVAILMIAVTTKRSITVNYGCCKEFGENYDPNETTGIFEGRSVAVPGIQFAKVPQYVLGIGSGEKWIEVDLSEQKLKAWEGDTLYLESLVSTGLPWWPTPVGEFTIWAKTRATKMEGGSGKYYYNLPNVPYVMFFQNDKVPSWRGYGLHGTYWHNDFGNRHSHGCVNLPTKIAEQLYYWTLPTMPEGKGWITADAETPGTKIVIHE